MTNHVDNPVLAVSGDAAGGAAMRGGHAAEGRMEDLAEIIRAYNAVTEKLQQSHERLQGEVFRLRRELASTNAQLQRSKRLSALGEMAAGIAHEIRNPLAAIQLYAGMVIEDLPPTLNPRPDIAAENARKIASAVRGLDGIVLDVLSFAREIQPRPQRLVVSEVFSRVIDAHRPAIESAGVAVQRGDHAGAAGRLPRASGASEPVTLDADADLLHQALLNLVRNAVDAMERADRRVLTLDARREEDSVVLAVRDTGPGIAAPDVDRIFNPFFTTRNTGTGLGLAIVHRIVDAHGGAIVVHNAADDSAGGDAPATGGAVFELTLPARVANATEVERAEAREDAA